MAKAYKKKTVKVTLTDTYSNRSLNFRVNASKFDDDIESKWQWLSDGQRKKAEDFFGKENAYHTSMSINLQ